MAPTYALAEKAASLVVGRVSALLCIGHRVCHFQSDNNKKLLLLYFINYSHLLSPLRYLLIQKRIPGLQLSYAVV